MTIQLGEPLKLNGSLLDLGSLNKYYNISIEIFTDEHVPCIVLDVKNDYLTCQPNIGEKFPDSAPKHITVSIKKVFGY